MFIGSVVVYASFAIDTASSTSIYTAIVDLSSASALASIAIATDIASVSCYGFGYCYCY